MQDWQPDSIALIRLAIEAPSPAAFQHSLAQLPASSRLHQLAATHPEAWQLVHSILAAVDHDARSPDPATHLRRIAEMFDRAVAISPEASVALYSLGDADALAAATADIVAWLDARGLLGPDIRVLDIGCGIGRLEHALAGRTRQITGIDIAPAMVAEARRRCANLPNVSIMQITGTDLTPFADASCELVIALDSFPYVVAAGNDLSARLIAEASRVLAAGGYLAIFNYAYEGGPDRQAQEVQRLGRDAGLLLREAGTQPFASWDGRVFLLARL